ncbi:MAG: hypothetical protein JSV39_04455, partial [Candidatus Aenigmatarchaeota archaeon]
DVQVNDTDRGLIRDLGNGNFYVTSNEDTYAISEAQYVWVLDDTKSVTSEHLINVFPFSDRCNYRIGPQKWKVEYEYDGWFTTNSSLFNVNLTTDPLVVNLQLPETNKTMRKGIDSLLIRGNVTDDCVGWNQTANATINFTVPQQNYFCTAVNDEGEGWYNCTIPAADPVTGDWGYNYYNLTMNASKKYYNSSSTLNKQDAFILISNPEILTLTIDSVCARTDLNSSCTDFSWGELWKFNASIRDQDHAGPLGEELNISLYVNVSGGWKFLNSTVRTGLGTWDDVELTYHDFNCSDMGPREFMFNITDIYGYQNSSNASETIKKDNVYIYWDADPISIDREGSNTGEFRIRVRDADNDTYVPVNVNTSFWFSPNNDFNEYGPPYDNQTYSGGYARYHFDPNCNYQTGQQFWMAGVRNDQCYLDENFTDPPYGPGSRQFDIIGQLKNWIVTPNWTAGQPQFNVTNQIPVRFNVTSECSNQPSENPISGVTRSLELQAPNASWETPYSPDEYQSGFYNYTWDSTEKDEGNWSIRINTSIDDYNPNSTYLPDWFWLENIPPENVTSPSVSPSSDGWTRWFNFTIQINDPENDTTNCTLWVSTDNGGNWTDKGMDTLADGTGVCEVIVNDFNESDVNFTAGFDTDNYFFFQIMDEENEWNTSNVSGPVLEPANITIYYMAGNNSEVSVTYDSSDSTLFLLNVSDDDNQSVPVPMNVTIYVQLNDTHWDWGNTSKTNSSGHRAYYFAPNCSYEPGIRKWYAESTDVYYEQEKTENFTVMMNGSLVNTLITPQGLEVLRGFNVTIQVKVNDSCGENITDANLTMRMVSNKTGENFTCDDITHVGDGYYNCTFNTSANPDVMPAKGYEIIINSSKESYVSDTISVNCSSSSSFFIETEPVIENNSWSLTPSDDWGWGETYTFTVNVSDEDEDNMTVKIWVNVRGGWDNIYTNSTVKGVNQTVTYVYDAFDNDDIGDRQYVINVTDDGDYPQTGGSSYNDTTPYENFTLDQDNVSFQILLGYEDIVQRVTGSFTFRVRVWDIDKDPNETTSDVKGRFWYTKDGGNWTESTERFSDPDTNLTFSSSEISFDCTFLVRPQWWKAGIYENAYYKDTNTTNISWTIVTTPLNATMWLSSDHYLRGKDNITATANISESDGCGQVSGACVFFNITQENERCPLAGCAPEINNGIYQCNVTPNRHSGWTSGIWYNVTTNVTKNHYNGTALLGNESELFYLATNPYFSSLQAIRSGGAGSTGGWGETWEFRADLYDPDYDDNNVSLYANLTGGWEKINESLDRSPGLVRFLGHQFNCSVLQGQTSSQKQFNFTSIDVWNYTNTSVANFTLEKDDTSPTRVTPAGVTINRDFDDNETLEIYIRDTDNGSS